jgi:NitT/TauT family transport system substrate-binding protein
MNPRIRPRHSLLALATAATVALAACGGSSGSDDQGSSASTGSSSAGGAPVKAKIMLEYPANASHVYMISGQERGTFKKDGIDPDVVFPDDPSTPVKALGAGRVDFALQLSTGPVIAKAQGTDVKIIGTLENLPLGILTLSDKVKSFKDLKGGTVGITDSTWNKECLKRTLAGNGMTEKDIKVVDPGTSLAAPLISGKLQGVIGSQYEQAIIKTQTGRDTHVFEYTDYCPKSGIQILTTGKMIKEHPDTVRKMLKGISDSLAWSMANPDEAAAIYGKKFPEQNAKSNLAQWKASVPTFCEAYSEEKGLLWADPEQYQRLIQLVVDAGVLDKSYPVDTIVDDSFLPSPPNTKPCANDLYKRDPLEQLTR